jgi:multidrug efflux pump subunit AcrB
MEWFIPFDTTVFIQESAREVVHTPVEAIAVVFIVVFIFPQS